MNGAVDVALGGEIDDRARLVFGQQFANQGTITDVALHEEVPTVALQTGQILQIAGIGELVEIEDRFVVGFKPVEYEVRADEAGAASYENHQGP